MNTKLRFIILSFISLILLAGCGGGLTLNINQVLPTVTSLDRVQVRNGDSVVMTGKNLRADMRLMLVDQPIEYTLTDSTTARFSVPTDAPEGLLKLVVQVEDQTIASFPLFKGEDLSALQETSLPVDKICSDIAFKNAAGQIQTGTRVCGLNIKSCASDGETDCLTSDAAPAAAKNGAAAKIMQGAQLLGILGTVPAAVPDCDAQQAEPCTINDQGYKAAILSTFDANDIRSGVTIGFITGLMSLTPCTADGQTNCLTTASFPAVDKVNTLQSQVASIQAGTSLAGVAGTLALCNADAAIGCVSTTNFPAAETSGAAAKIVMSQTLAGISGSAPAKPADCHLDGATGCVTVPTYPSADHTAIDTNKAMIASSLTIVGVTGTLSSCATEGNTSCVAVAAYPSIDQTNLTANRDKIRSTTTLAGVSGTLDDCAADADVSCVANTNFPAMDKAVAASKILQGQSLGGVAGSSAGRPSDCAADGEVSCVTRTAFPAMDSVADSSKILSGQTLGGISGTASTRPADCSTSGDQGCVTLTTYPAVDKTSLTNHAAQMRSSLTLIGVTGTLPNCMADGETSCVAIGPSFAAADLTNASAKILTGETVAGVAGSTALRPADCALDGGTDCVTTASFPALKTASAAAKIVQDQTLGGVIGTAPNLRAADCASDGETACTANTDYHAMQVAGAAAKIAAGDHLAGVQGTASVRPSDCAADGASNCVAIPNYPAVDVSNLTANKSKIRSSLTLAGVTGTLADCSTDGGTGCVTNASYASADTASLAAKVAQGQVVAGITGTAQTKPGDCTLDAATGCVTVNSFPAVDKTDLTNNAANLRSSLSLGGVTGTLNDCAGDGNASCRAVTSYPSANTTGAAAKILTGQTLAGVNGTAQGKPADCSTEGQINCLATSSMTAVKKASITAATGLMRSSLSLVSIAGTMPDCASDGQSSCFTTSSFPAGNTVGAAAKIELGQTLVGVTGTAPLKPANCSSDNATNCVTVTNYPAISSTTVSSSLASFSSSLSLAGLAGTLADCSGDAQTSCLSTTAFPSMSTSSAAAKILTGQVLGGINGSAALRPADCSAEGTTDCVTVTGYPSVDSSNITSNRSKFRTGISIVGKTGLLADCAADNSSGCVAVTNYPSIVVANLSPGVLKSGTTIAGVTGVYPNSTYPMPTPDGYSDLTSTTFSTQIASSSSFGYFNRNGTRMTSTGSSLLIPNSVKSGVNIFGVSGNLVAISTTCSSDAQADCVTTSTLPATYLEAYDLRLGKSIMGVTGKLDFLKSNASTAQFNRTTGTAASSGVDIYDTLDDYKPLTATPAEVPAGWSVNNASNWKMLASADNGSGGGTANDNICNGSEVCIFVDQYTGLRWYRPDYTGRTWENAITTCASGTWGSLSWRLPTQKEIMKVYIDGLVPLMRTTGKIPGDTGQEHAIWSSTTDSESTTTAWKLDQWGGNVNNYAKTNTAAVLCVGP